MKEVSKNPLISVIVPVYNVEKYLRRCIDSIINQTYKNLEVIIVDDGSTDDCPKICDEYEKKDDRIKVIHKQNGGVSSARNAGIEKCNGEWVTFVDADDWLNEDFCNLMLYEAIKQKVYYISCGYKVVYSNGNNDIVNGDGKVLEFFANIYLVKLLNVQNSYGYCTMKMIKKSVINKFRFDEKLQVGEDALFNVQLCEKIDRAIILNKPLYNHYINTNSLVRKYDNNYLNKYLSSMNVMYEYIFNIYFDNKKIVQNLYNYISYHVLIISVNYCFHPNNINKKESLKKLYEIEIFQEAILNSNYEDLSLTRKIGLFALKHKLYFIMSIVCKIRQFQLNKKK